MEIDVIYKASCIDQNLNEFIYIGETAETLTFKKRCGGHYTSFNNIAYKNETALAKNIWNLQKNIMVSISTETN